MIFEVRAAAGAVVQLGQRRCAGGKGSAEENYRWGNRRMRQGLRQGRDRVQRAADRHGHGVRPGAASQAVHGTGQPGSLAPVVAGLMPLRGRRDGTDKGVRVNQGMHQQVQKQERRYDSLRFQGRSLNEAR